MATVNGITVTKAQQIEDDSVVSGDIVNSRLILTKGDASTEDVGEVGGAAAVTAHNESTTSHGTTGAVVGTTNTQTISNKTLTTPIIASFINAQHSHTSAALGGNVSVDAVLASFDASLTSQSLGAGDVDVEKTLASTDTLAAGKYLIMASCLGFTLGGATSTRLKWGLSTSSGTLRTGAVSTHSQGTALQGGTSVLGYLDNASNAVVTFYAMKLNDSGVLADTSTNGFLIAVRVSDMT